MSSVGRVGSVRSSLRGDRGTIVLARVRLGMEPEGLVIPKGRFDTAQLVGRPSVVGVAEIEHLLGEV